MAVYVNNITINPGEDFTQNLSIEKSLGEVVNLTGYALSSYIRKHPSSSKVVAGFGITITNTAEGEIRLSLASTITSTISPGRYVYDILAIQSGPKKTVVVEGDVIVKVGISS